MSRETLRQIERIHKLANFIEANPKEYDQNLDTQCVVGLGNRLRRGKLAGEDDIRDCWNVFAKYYGVTDDEATDIYFNCFGRVVKGFKNGVYNRTAKSAVKFLRALAEQKTLDKW